MESKKAEDKFETSKKDLKKNQKREIIVKKEKELYLTSEIEEKFIKTSDLFLTKETYIHYTIISKTKETKDNKLVLIHGYGGMGCIFFRLIKKLSEKFYIIILDLPGMAFNFRDKKVENFKTDKEWLDFFVENINLFLEKLKIGKFSLFGHSLGGYISGHFFERYSEKIIKLFLSSPAGFNSTNEENLKEHHKKINNFNFVKKFFVKKTLKNIYEKKKTPFNYLIWPFRKPLLYGIMSKKKFLNRDQKSFLTNILNYFFSEKQYTEHCIGYLLENGVKGKRCIFDIIWKKNKFVKNICIFYGETDWMDFKETQKNLKIGKLDIELHVVPKSGHGLNLENPDFVTEKMLNFMKK